MGKGNLNFIMYQIDLAFELLCMYNLDDKQKAVIISVVMQILENTQRHEVDKNEVIKSE